MRKFGKIFLSAIFFLILHTSLCAKEYNIVDYGAKSGFKSTNAIQSAIDDCNKQGGGKVVVPAGSYIIGTIFLKSNVELYLQAGASLLGSEDSLDYKHNDLLYGLIYAEDEENISISGQGEIDANGTSFYDSTRNHLNIDFNQEATRQGKDYYRTDMFHSDGPIARGKFRPQKTIIFFNCQNVKILDVTIRDTPSWAIRIGTCDDIKIRGISIHNNLMVPNSDGIHCTLSSNVIISDCLIRAGDDAIIVTGFPKPIMDANSQSSRQVKDTKTYRFGNHSKYAENVVVSNCVLQSRSSAIRVGYGEGSIRNCIFSNIVIIESNRGLGVYARDAGNIENILFKDITIKTRVHNGWWGNGEVIHVSSVNQNKDQLLGKIKNIRFENIIAKGGQGIVVWGSDERRVEHVQFNNIQLKIEDGPQTRTFGGNMDMRPSLSRDQKVFKRDIPGILCVKADNISISRFDIEWDGSLPSFFTYAIEGQDVSDLWIHNSCLHSSPSSGLKEAVLLDNVSNYSVTNPLCDWNFVEK